MRRWRNTRTRRRYLLLFIFIVRRRRTRRIMTMDLLGDLLDQRIMLVFCEVRHSCVNGWREENGREFWDGRKNGRVCWMEGERNEGEILTGRGGDDGDRGWERCLRKWLTCGGRRIKYWDTILMFCEEWYICGVVESTCGAPIACHLVSLLSIKFLFIFIFYFLLLFFIFFELVSISF